jgi:hypothetical protein
VVVDPDRTDERDRYGGADVGDGRTGSVRNLNRSLTMARIDTPSEIYRIVLISYDITG